MSVSFPSSTAQRFWPMSILETTYPLHSGFAAPVVDA